MARGGKPTAGPKTGRPKTAAKPKSQALAPVSNGLATTAAPADLPDQAKDAWDIFLAEMVGNRHVREADLPLLKAYVMSVFEHEDASKSIIELGTMVKVTRYTSAGEPYEAIIPNPALKIRHQAATQMRYYSDLLGLNPVARIRQNLAEVAGQSMLLDIRDRLVREMT